MKKFTLRLVLVAFALGFGIFYGIAVTSKTASQTAGVPQQAPAGAVAKEKSAATDRPGPPVHRPAKTAKPEPPRLSEQGVPMPDSFMNRLSNKIGDAFRHLTKWLVAAALAIFESILG